MDKLKEKTGFDFDSKMLSSANQSEKIYIIPPDRIRYLSEIAEASETYNEWVDKHCKIARKLYQIQGVMHISKELESSLSPTERLSPQIPTNPAITFI